MSTRLTKLPALALAAVVTGMLSSAAILGAAHAQPSGDGAVHAAKHHHKRHHRARRHAVRGIPQHNGGDHDADNRGGPSDGDGNI
jgi:hypothetical protein